VPMLEAAHPRPVARARRQRVADPRHGPQAPRQLGAAPRRARREAGRRDRRRPAQADAGDEHRPRPSRPRQDGRGARRPCPRPPAQARNPRPGRRLEGGAARQPLGRAVARPLWQRGRAAIIAAARDPDAVLAGRMGEVLRSPARRWRAIPASAARSTSSSAARSPAWPQAMADRSSAWSATPSAAGTRAPSPSGWKSAVGRDLQYIRINGTWSAAGRPGPALPRHALGLALGAIPHDQPSPAPSPSPRTTTASASTAGSSGTWPTRSASTSSRAGRGPGSLRRRRQEGGARRPDRGRPDHPHPAARGAARAQRPPAARARPADRRRAQLRPRDGDRRHARRLRPQQAARPRDAGRDQDRPASRPAARRPADEEGSGPSWSTGSTRTPAAPAGRPLGARAAFFSKSFSGRTARKVYWALVVGVTSAEDEG
jgi:hypothetical protein